MIRGIHAISVLTCHGELAELYGDIGEMSNMKPLYVDSVFKLKWHGGVLFEGWKETERLNSEFGVVSNG